MKFDSVVSGLAIAVAVIAIIGTSYGFLFFTEQSVKNKVDTGQVVAMQFTFN